jgi:hypothetical protein
MWSQQWTPVSWPASRAPGVIGAEREEKRRGHAVLAQELDERRHPLAGAAQRVDVDLQREAHDGR